MSSLPPPPPGWSGTPGQGPQGYNPGYQSYGQQGYGMPMTPAGGGRWRSMKGLSIALGILLGISAVLSAVTIWALRDRKDQIERYGFGTTPGDAGYAAVHDADDLVTSLSGFLVLAGLVVFILLLIWSWRGAKNLEVLGRQDPTLGPGWAIGSWFIPLANFVLGFLVLKDVWKGGEASVPWGDRAWKQVRVGTSLIIWWILLFAAGVAAFASGAVTDEELDTLQEVRDNANFGAVSFGLSALASVAAILAILAMTRRQQATYDAQQASRGQSPFGGGTPYPYGQQPPPAAPGWGAPPPPPPPGWG